MAQNEKAPCCTPQVSGPTRAAPEAPVTVGSQRRVDDTAVRIPGGRAMIGTKRPVLAMDGEGPLRSGRVNPFLMAATTVTNAQFAAFVADTGFETEAEKFGWSFVFWSDVPDRLGPTQAVANAQWWRRVDGATWRDIHGPETEAEVWDPDHPVVHVSWNDARAYAHWVGGRLPGEAEWEHAARGGQGDVRYPWGEAEPDDTGFLPCNIWQGEFPERNSAQDGYASTAPARSFAPNGYGLYNMVGNVWEWCADSYRIKSLKRQAQAQMKQMRHMRLMKGGSFLCHRSYCHRYRIAARTGTSPDSTTPHQGIRIVWDI